MRKKKIRVRTHTRRTKKGKKIRVRRHTRTFYIKIIEQRIKGHPKAKIRIFWKGETNKRWKRVDYGELEQIGDWAKKLANKESSLHELEV